MFISVATDCLIFTKVIILSEPCQELDYIFLSVSLLTVPSANKIDKFSKITNWIKLKNKQHQSKVLLNSFLMNGDTLVHGVKS